MWKTNKLFLNTSQGGELSFKDISKTANISEPIYSFPTWFFDLIMMGYEDIFVAEFGDVTKSKASFVVDSYLGNDSEADLEFI